MRIYIAGKMRGVPLYNFPAFDSAADDLRAMGHEPVSPADLDREAGFDPATLPNDHDWTTVPEALGSYEKVMRRDLDALRWCDAILMLDGWEDSTGARSEREEARSLGLRIFHSIHDVPDIEPDTPPRKQYPIASGFLQYFPKTVKAVAHCSYVGNAQHNDPDKPIHWDRTKSADHDDCMMRHYMEGAALDDDRIPHCVKVVWRASARCELMLEAMEASND